MSRDSRSEPSTAIAFECDLADPPEKVWRALTTPHLVAAWLAPNDIKPTTGSRFTLRAAPDINAIDCVVLASEPNRLLRYSWRSADAPDGDREPDSVVTFELSRTDVGGTRLRLVHDAVASDVRALALVRRAPRAVHRRPLIARSASRPKMLLAA